MMVVTVSLVIVMKLYTYWRSSCAYRARIALNLKALSCESVAVDLIADGGWQHSETYRRVNPQSLVPSLEVGADTLVQSLAIIEYLEENYPEPALLPADPVGRARVRGLSYMIACDMQPLNNLRVLQYLRGPMAQSEDTVGEWYRHWIANGFAALETRVQRERESGIFMHGDTPGLADVCLVPQVYNAGRFDCPLDAYPRLSEIHDACQALGAFAAAVPENQPDAV